MRNAFQALLALLLIFCLFFGGSLPAFAACSSPTGSAGTLRYNSDYHVYQYCDNTNWKAMGAASTAAVSLNYLNNETSSSGSKGIWSDGTYIYIGRQGGARVYSFDGTSFTLKASNTVNTVHSLGVWGDGTYIYFVDFDSATTSTQIDAYTFNGSALTYVASSPSFTSTAGGVWGDGTYIYFSYSSGVKAYTFNGASFTLSGSLSLSYSNRVWGDGSYIYVAAYTNGINVYSFNGSSFTYKASNATDSTGSADVWGDGTYIYVADGSGGLDAYTFNGTSLTYIASASSTNALGVWGDGTYIYVADGSGGLDVYTFNGSSFTFIATDTNHTNDAYDVWGDGTYIYVADGYDAAGYIDAYSKFTNSCTTPTATAGSMLYNADWRVMQYCNGSSWKSMGPTIRTFSPAVTFDGTNDYLTYGTSFGADSTMATASFWFRRNGGNGSQQILFCVEGGTTDCRFEIDLTTGNKVHVRGSSSGGGGTGTTRVEMTGGTAITDTNWHHALLSFDASDTTGCTTSVSTGKCKIYLDGAAETVTVNTTFSNAAIDFTRTSYSFGAFGGGTGKFNGDLDDFWLDEGTYLDLSQAGVRAQFRDASGNPVDLGATGTNPTGSQPEVYLSSRGNGLSGWATNKGSGGGFTTTGALTAATANLPNLSCSHAYEFNYLTTDVNTSSPQKGWSDETYIYVADTNRIRIFRRDGSSLTYLMTTNTYSNHAYGVWGDGTYIYVADNSTGLDVYQKYDGTSLTYITSDTTHSTSAQDVWGDGTYIYVADVTGGLDVYSFDGTSLTYITSDTTNSTTARGVWGDGTYIYVADDTSLDVYSFNGTSLTYITSDTTHSTWAEGVWGDGTYIYVADNTGKLDAYSFNGTTLTYITNAAAAGQVSGVWGDGHYIYAASLSTGLQVFTFNGTSFTYITKDSTHSTYASSVWGREPYIYVTNVTTGALDLYRTALDTCSCSSPTAVEGTKLYNSDHGVYQYCNGANWMRMGQ